MKTLLHTLSVHISIHSPRSCGYSLKANTEYYSSSNDFSFQFKNFI